MLRRISLRDGLDLQTFRWRSLRTLQLHPRLFGDAAFGLCNYIQSMLKGEAAVRPEGRAFNALISLIRVNIESSHCRRFLLGSRCTRVLPLASSPASSCSSRASCFLVCTFRIASAWSVLAAPTPTLEKCRVRFRQLNFADQVIGDTVVPCGLDRFLGQLLKSLHQIRSWDMGDHFQEQRTFQRLGH